MSDEKVLLDQHGNPMPSRPSLRQRLSAATTHWKAIAASSVALLAIIAGVIANIDTIKSAFTTDPPEFTIYEEADLFEEYYLLVSSHSSHEDALAKEAKLVELSVLSDAIDALPGSMDPKVIMRSSKISIGFGPDQVIVARDPSKLDHFIIALDLLGSNDEDDPTLVREEGQKIIQRINNKMNNIENDDLYSEDPKIKGQVKKMKATAMELKRDLSELTVGFYEIAMYERTYGTTVERK